MRNKKIILMVLLMSALILTLISMVSATLSVTLVSPTDADATNSTSMGFTAKITQTNATCDTQNLTLYSDFYGSAWRAIGVNTSVPNNTNVLLNDSIDMTAIADGTYRWNAYAKDNCSGSTYATANYTIIIDDTPGNMTTYSPTIATGRNFEATFTTDASTNTCKYSTNYSDAYATMGTTIGTGTSIKATLTFAVGQGLDYWYVKCKDNRDNRETTSHNITVDRRQPAGIVALAGVGNSNPILVAKDTALVGKQYIKSNSIFGITYLGWFYIGALTAFGIYLLRLFGVIGSSKQSKSKRRKWF